MRKERAIKETRGRRFIRAESEEIIPHLRVMRGGGFGKEREQRFESYKIQYYDLYHGAR